MSVYLYSYYNINTVIFIIFSDHSVQSEQFCLMATTWACKFIWWLPAIQINNIQMRHPSYFSQWTHTNTHTQMHVDASSLSMRPLLQRVMLALIHWPAGEKTHKEQSIHHWHAALCPVFLPANPVRDGKPDPARFLRRATLIVMYHSQATKCSLRLTQLIGWYTQGNSSGTKNICLPPQKESF